MEEIRRQALILGISKFPVEYEDLDFCQERTVELSEALVSLGYSCTHPSDSRLESDELGGEVRNAIAQAGDNSVVVVHVLSHGRVGDRTKSVYVVGSDGRHGPLTRVEQWLSVAEDFPGPQVLFLLDICQAGAAARVPWQLNTVGANNRTWVIGAASGRQAAFDGRFTRAVSDVLRALAAGEIDIDPSMRYVPLPTVARAIDRRMLELRDRDWAPHQEVTCTVVDIKHARDLELPFFPNPRYRPDAAREFRRGMEPAVDTFLDELDDALDAQHFLNRASGHGVLEGSTLAGMFQGRTRQLRDLSDWIDDPSGDEPRVVTGSPGVGKSALLGILLCASHPALSEHTHHLWSRVARTPSVQERMAAVHARQRDLDEILASLGRQLGLDDVRTCPDLIEALSGLPSPPLVLVDALDEAIQPGAIQTVLLLPLTKARRADGRRVVRLLVGVRPWDEFAPLREAAGVIDLDEVPADELRADLQRYAIDVLRTRPGYRSGPREVREALATALADRLTEAEGGEFLVAGLFLHHVSTAVPPATTIEKAQALGSTAPCTLPEIMELDLARMDVPVLREVLTTLAHARGDGMPESLIEVAGVRGALAAARFYIRHSVERDGTTLYRLFHQGLADYLRDRPFDLRLDRVWRTAEPYLLRHAASHAVETGNLDELLTDAEFLVHADPHLLTRELDHARSASARLAAAVYRHSFSRHGSDTLQGRREILLVDAARYGAGELASGLTIGVDLVPRWCTGSQTAPSLRATLSGHKDSVTAIACTTFSGRTIAVTASEDRTLRMWDLETGHPIGAPLTGHTGPVTSVAITTLDGRQVVVSGSRDCSVRIWDLASGESLGRPLLRHSESVTAVACGELDGHPIAISVGDYMMCVWDLSEHRLLTELPGSWEYTVICEQVGVHAILIAGGDNNVIRQWNLNNGIGYRPPIVTGEPRRRQVLSRHIDNQISALCTFTDAGSRIVAVGKSDGTLRLWDLDTQQPHSAEVQAHQEALMSLAYTTLDGTPVLLSAGNDGVRTWDLPSLSTRGTTLTGHNEWVWSAAVTNVGDHPTAVTGGGDNVVRLWDIADLNQLDSPLPGPAEFVQTLDICRIGDREVAVSGGNDRLVRIWDLTSGHPLHPPMAGHTGRIFGLACTDLDGQPVAVTTDMDGSILVWNLVDGTVISRAKRDNRLFAVACIDLGGGPIAAIAGSTVIEFLDVATLRSLHGPMVNDSRTAINSIAYSHMEGKAVAVTGSNDRTVQLWDINEGRACGRPMTGHSGDVNAVVCAEIDGRPTAISGDQDGVVRTWDLTTQSQIKSWTAHRRRVTSLRAVERDGQLTIISTGQGGIRMWNAGDGRLLQQFALPMTPVCLSMARNGDLVLGVGWEILVMRHQREGLSRSSR